MKRQEKRDESRFQDAHVYPRKEQENQSSSLMFAMSGYFYPRFVLYMFLVVRRLYFKNHKEPLKNASLKHS